MENFDQLDTLIHENQTLIKHVILFVISAMLIFVMCSLFYFVIYHRKQIKDQNEIIMLRNFYLENRNNKTNR
nr:unknown [Pieris rapae granulovirus]